MLQSFLRHICFWINRLFGFIWDFLFVGGRILVITGRCFSFVFELLELLLGLLGQAFVLEEPVLEGVIGWGIGLAV